MNGFQHYCSNLGALLREAALQARQEALTAEGSEGYQFQNGRLTAYYEVLSLMIQQAEAFDLPLEQLSLADFDPARELLVTEDI